MTVRIIFQFVAVILMFALSDSAFAGDLEDGDAAYDRGDYATAYSKYTKAAEQGDSSAQNTLGLMYDQGQGVAQDYEQAAGWYSHTMKNKEKQVTFSVCVGYRRHRNRKDSKQVKQKLLFAAWRVHGSPTEIRERYRKRFGIETSYRQMRQARIYTCTRNPRLRLFFVALALTLRNLWVWVHQTRLAEGTGNNPTLHLERLRFKRMLDWIVHEVLNLFHDGSTPYTARDP